MSQPPRWVPALFGVGAFLMGAIILGAFFGLVPTDGGQFTAPPAVILALGFGLILFAVMLWVPARASTFVKSGLFLVGLLAVAIVCNWTAFAPQVLYSSSTSIGPFQFGGQDQIGGRIAFGIAALTVDAAIVAALVGWIRSAARRARPPAE